MKQYPRKIENLIDRAFDKCNLIGEDCDIWAVLYSYKTIANLPDDELEEIYQDIAQRLGFMR